MAFLCISKNFTGLFHAHAGQIPNEIINRDENIREREWRGVRRPDAVFLFSLALNKPWSSFFHDKKCRSFRGFGQNGNKIGISSCGNKLLCTVNDIPCDLTGIILYRFGLGL